jgi:hypothetical protein
MGCEHIEWFEKQFSIGISLHGTLNCPWCPRPEPKKLWEKMLKIPSIKRGAQILSNILLNPQEATFVANTAKKEFEQLVDRFYDHPSDKNTKSELKQAIRDM